jgi:hypothetical protein
VGCLKGRPEKDWLRNLDAAVKYGGPGKEDALKGSTRSRLDSHTQADTWDRQHNLPCLVVIP